MQLQLFKISGEVIATNQVTRCSLLAEQAQPTFQECAGNTDAPPTLASGFCDVCPRVDDPKVQGIRRLRFKKTWVTHFKEKMRTAIFRSGARSGTEMRTLQGKSRDGRKSRP